MPVTLKLNKMKYKSDLLHKYVGINGVAERTTAELVKDLQEAGEARLDEIDVHVAEAQTAVDGIEDQKNQMIAAIAAAAGLGTDTTLSTTGMAADAKVTGDILTDKADKDGMYTQLTAGSAMEVVSDSGDTDTAVYVSRETGGGKKVYNREMLKKIVGGTVAWNQFISKPTAGAHEKNGLEWTIDNDGCITLSGTATARTTIYAFYARNVTKDHIYAMSTCQYLSYHSDWALSNAADVDGWQIRKANSNSSSSSYIVECMTLGKEFSNKKLKVQLIDLTQIFGSAVADAIYAMEQKTAGSGVAFFRSLFPNDYYAASARTLMSVQAKEHRMYDESGNVIASYAFDPDLVLRGIPKLDSDGKLYYDGDEYTSDGKVLRKYGIRAYASGDESIADAITDGTNTVYKLTIPVTEYHEPYKEIQFCDANGSEEFVDAGVTASTPTRDVTIPVYAEALYPMSVNKIVSEVNKISGISSELEGINDQVNNSTTGIGAKAPAIIRTASGTIATFYDGADSMPIKGLVCEIKPVQSGLGDPSPTNVRPISGHTAAHVTNTGKNLVDITISAEASYGTWVFDKPIDQKIVISAKNNNVVETTNTWCLDVVFQNNSHYYIGGIGSTHPFPIGFTIDKNNPIVKINYRSSHISSGSYNIQVEYGSTATEYEPFGQIITIPFKDENNQTITVYGGILDAFKKKLTINMDCTTVGDQTWEKYSDAHIFYTDIQDRKDGSQNVITSAYTYEDKTDTGDAWQTLSDQCYTCDAEGKTIYIRDDDYSDAATFASAMSEVQIVYELANSLEYSTDPITVSSLLGENRVWTDCNGDTAVEYCADTLLCIQPDSLIERITNTEEKIKSFTRIDENALNRGYYVKQSGVYGAYPYQTIGATDEISVIGISALKVYTCLRYCFIAFYNEKSQPIQPVIGTRYGTGMGLYELEVPQNATYVRISCSGELREKNFDEFYVEFVSNIKNISGAIAGNIKDISDLQAQDLVLEEQINDIDDDKLSKPTVAGTNGQILSTNGNGENLWIDQYMLPPEQISEALADYISEHPEAVTSVEDWSLVYSKLTKGTLEFVFPQMYGAEANGVHDDTPALQAAINSGKMVLVPSGTYLVTTETYNRLNIGSNVTMIFANGAILKGKNTNRDISSILNIWGSDNVTIIGGELYGDVEANTSTSEGAGHGLQIMGSTNVTIKDMYIHDCFTDGCYVNGLTRGRFENCKFKHNGRMGHTIIHGKDIVVQNCVAEVSFRTAPKYSFGMEPNSPNETLENIVYDNCVAIAEPGTGTESNCFYFNLHSFTTSNKVNITYNNCTGINGTFFFGECDPNENEKLTGQITINNYTSIDAKGSPFMIGKYSAYNTCRIVVNNPSVINANRAQNQGANGKFLNVAYDNSEKTYGNLLIRGALMKDGGNLIKEVSKWVNTDNVTIWDGEYENKAYENQIRYVGTFPDLVNN